MVFHVWAAKEGTNDQGHSLNLSGADRITDPITGKKINALPADGDYSSATATITLTGDTISNAGAWNSVKTLKVVTDISELPGASLNISNFVHVDLNMRGSEDATLAVDGMKRGTVRTGDGSDNVTVGVTTNGGWNEEITINTRGGNDYVTVLGATNPGWGSNRTDGVGQTVKANLGDGNDYITVAALASDTTLNGGAGDDTIIGSSGSNILRGNEGNDSLVGGVSNDTLNGGEGSDTLSGGAGDDKLAGGEGNDLLLDGSGANTLNGGAGDDTLAGGTGNDTLHGGDGNDLLSDDTGDNKLTGAAGNDTITGGTGNDTLHGGADNDVLDGGKGNDDVRGGDGNDVLEGSGGDDILRGGDGNDILTDHGSDGLSSGNDSLVGGNGDDTITAGDGIDTMHGGTGNNLFVIQDMVGDTDFIQGFGNKNASNVIDVSEFGIPTFADLNMTQVGKDVVIDFGDGQSVTLLNYKLDKLTEDHFTGFTGASTPGEVIEGTSTGPFVAEGLIYQDVGEFEVIDVNNDGIEDIVSVNGSYGAGVVWYDGTDLTQVTRISYNDPGIYDLADFNGDGIMDVVTTAQGGIGWYDGSSQQAFNRVSYVDAGDDLIVHDMDGNGSMDVLSINGALGGVVWYEGDGTVHRLTYNTLTTYLDNPLYRLGDFNGDGSVDLLATFAQTQTGATIDGTVYFELDGTMNRFAYMNFIDMTVGNFDDDAADEVIAYETGSYHGTIIVGEGQDVARLTYNNLSETYVGTFGTGDFDNDGELEVFGMDGYGQSGNTISGLVYYDLDGTMHRMNFGSMDDFDVASWAGSDFDSLFVKGGTFGNNLYRLVQSGGADDTLLGTVNDDTIIGGGGNDTLTGDAGADIFTYGVNFGSDVITDFGLGNDVLAFTGIAGIGLPADIITASSVVGLDTVISLTGGTITLQGFTGLAESDITVV